MRLSDEHLDFLARLARMPEGRSLVSLLKARLADRDSNLRAATGEEVLRSQGRALELADLIGDITMAEDKLTRSRTTATPLRSRATATI